MPNINGFVTIINSKIGCGYVLGSQGQIMSEKLLNVLKYNYSLASREANYNVALKWIGKQCFDCSGLIIWTLQQLNILKSTEDYVAHDIYYKLCEPVNKADLIAGDLCFVYDKSKKKIVHVGVYVGNSQVVHARGTSYGVVKTGVLPYFGMYGRLKCFEQEEEDSMTVKEFQAIRKIEADGIVGKQTITEFLKVAEDYYRMKQILSDLVKE